jgi:hypothetical protein
MLLEPEEEARRGGSNRPSKGNHDLNQASAVHTTQALIKRTPSVSHGPR